MLAALLDSVCLGDGGLFVLCTLYLAQCSMCGSVYMRLTVLIVSADIFGYLVNLSALRASLMVQAGCDLIF